METKEKIVYVKHKDTVLYLVPITALKVATESKEPSLESEGPSLEFNRIVAAKESDIVKENAMLWSFTSVTNNVTFNPVSFKAIDVKPL